jgi:hypothetical protein
MIVGIWRQCVCPGFNFRRDLRIKLARLVKNSQNIIDAAGRRNK